MPRLPAGSLGSAECLPCRHLGMQLRQNRLLGDLARFLDLKLLVQCQARLAGCDLEDSTLHERVQHAVLDGPVTRGDGAGVDEKQGVGLGAIMSVAEAVEGKARLGGGDGLREIGNGGGVLAGGDELDRLLLGVDFLVAKRLGTDLVG